MKKIINQYLMLTFVIVFLNSCNAQNQKIEKQGISITTSGLLKIAKPEFKFQEAAIGCSLIDKAGNIWFGSNGQGIYRYDGKTFTHFTFQDEEYNNIVYSMIEDNEGKILIGTKYGLFKFDGKDFSQIPFVLKLNLYANLNHTQNNNPSFQNGVWCMMKDKNGTIWFGTDDGVFCNDGTGFTRFLNDDNIINKDSLQLNAIVSIMQDSKGNIWFASNLGEGLIRFDGKNLNRITPKSYGWTQSIEEDKIGNIWFTTIGKGVCRYDGKSIISNYFNEKKPNEILYSLWKDKSNNIWFGDPYNSKPLIYFNGNDVINFTEKNKLTDNKLFPVIEDNSGNIWFASSYMGLYKYDRKTFAKFSE